jgi:hypothetical protein
MEGFLGTSDEEFEWAMRMNFFAALRANATGVDGDTARQTIVAGIGGFATGRFTTPRRSTRASRCWPPSAPPTSPAPTTSSTAA